MIGFVEFRDGLGGQMCRRLGIDASMAESWDDLAWIADEYDTRTKGALTAAARRLQAYASTGERGLLHAVLAACNFTRLADELAGSETWDLMFRLDRAHRVAVAAAIARI